MRILLVNDDGILAPGLSALWSAVADMGEVTVVAPETSQSAAGRSLTLHGPVICNHVHVGGQFHGVSVAGRPVDCVKLAIRELMDSRPDLVLSGINAGENVGVNVFYSGTVSAGAEGALFGIPSVAFSLAGAGEMDFRRAGRLCRQVLDVLLSGSIAPGELVNVNIPALSQSTPRGVKVVPQSTAAISETYRRENDADGRMIFQLNDHFEHGPQDTETDVTALAEGFITVTPLMSDMTDHNRLGHFQQCRWGNSQR
ncbi:MAG: 5'/3'-nucleotidase SurE [Planctomycetota bacterium]|nr:5'/3'-nucleotidase SurE [Planctomycetota bacterium]